MKAPNIQIMLHTSMYPKYFRNMESVSFLEITMIWFYNRVLKKGDRI